MIPEFHQTSFLHYINKCPPKVYSPLVAKEINELKKERAPIQRCLQSIIAREQCLKHVLRIDKYIVDEDTQFDFCEQTKQAQVLQKCADIMYSLRLLTLNAIECITSWRNQFKYLLNTLQNQGFASNPQIAAFVQESYSSLPILPFLDHPNYLLKMKTDLDFLAESNLAKYFKFSKASDPLLITPA